MHVSLYHAALDRLADDPLTLTEADFGALLEFGGPQDERRGRDAQRTAQLALVTARAGPLLTKAARAPRAARATVPRYLEPASLGRVIAAAMHQVVKPLRERVTVLEAQRVRDQATISALQGELKAIGTLVTRDATPLPAPSLADLASSSSAKH